MKQTGVKRTADCYPSGTFTIVVRGFKRSKMTLRIKSRDLSAAQHIIWRPLH
jgi:hypothetical protein